MLPIRWIDLETPMQFLFGCFLVRDYRINYPKGTTLEPSGITQMVDATYELI